MPARTPSGRKPRLFFAGQNSDRRAPCGFRLADEFLAVVGIARGGRGPRFADRHVQPFGHHAETRQNLQRHLHAVGIEPPGGDHVAADAADRFFVVHRRRRARLRLVNHETHGVGPDIEDRDRSLGGFTRAHNSAQPHVSWNGRGSCHVSRAA